MPSARAALWKQYCRLHDLVVKIVGRSEPCRRFMVIPGVGPVTALSFMTPLAQRRGLLRADLAALAVGHLDRRSGSHIESRRC